MKHHEIIRPVGLNTPCEEIERTCSHAQMYRQCGLHPDHLILPLDAGSGRTTFLEYRTDRYKEAGVMPFISGPDDYLEIQFDGTLPQLRQAFAEIDAAAVYTNAYGNLVSMDISALAQHLGETQGVEFLKNIKKVCEHACVIFFVHAEPTRGEEKLLEKLCDSVDHIKRLTVEPYTRDDLCKLVIRSVEDFGIEIRQEDRFRRDLAKLPPEFPIDTVRDALTCAESIARFADYTKFVPVVDPNSLVSMLNEWNDEQKRSEMR